MNLLSFLRRTRPRQIDSADDSLLDVCTRAMEKVGDESEMVIIIVQTKDGILHEFTNRIYTSTKLGLLKAVEYQTLKGWFSE